uniref:Integration host factor (IHF), DNA-binding protein, beta subunit n=1 Tax=Magnetococcus massalia (strain MO-1) TaxID=451514 RepID=A0A1S7LJ71_MAGMO|nr:integration host factor (IHF), DNA-binding protein, beta subunit [Candidatus Magnetococcus massalia]
MRDCFLFIFRRLAIVIKSELILAMAEKHGLSIEVSSQVVDIVFNEISKGVAMGERTELRGFGVFEPRSRDARIARNPKSGKEVEVPAKTVVHFKPGLELRKRVDK